MALMDINNRRSQHYTYSYIHVRTFTNIEPVSKQSHNAAMFKTRLDNFWSNQEIIYDYHAEIQGIGSRSVVYYKLYKVIHLVFTIEETGKEARRLRLCFRLRLLAKPVAQSTASKSAVLIGRTESR